VLFAVIIAGQIHFRHLFARQLPDDFRSHIKMAAAEFVQMKKRPVVCRGES